MDTIFARASGGGKAGVAVIRVSGPLAFAGVQGFCGPFDKDHKAVLKKFRSASGDVLDECLVIGFPGPRSFTGEDVVELHTHGSPAVVRAVLSALTGCKGLREADPGEFTRRALENGKLDLAQVEGLADLIDAETEAQRVQAMRALDGALGDRAEEWRAKLLEAAALLEASIDFADEEVPVDVSPEVNALLNEVIASLEQEASSVSSAERLREGFEVAIVGAPNAGKSTLLNALAGRQAAITSEVAGTTRDVIEVHMDLGGIPVTFLDTAGLRQSEDQIETIGVDLAKKRASGADLRIFLGVVDNLYEVLLKSQDIVVSGKADLTGDPAGISGKTGQGVEKLVEDIQSYFQNLVVGIGVATRTRHRDALLSASVALNAAKTELEFGPDRSELAVEEMRIAIRRLDTLTGRIDIEDILDEIFSRFCLGK